MAEMTTIRILGADETRKAMPDLCEILSDCINGGASLGFMLPFRPQDGEAYWRDIFRGIGEGSIILAVAEMNGRVVGTVQVGLASKPTPDRKRVGSGKRGSGRVDHVG